MPRGKRIIWVNENQKSRPNEFGVCRVAKIISMPNFPPCSTSLRHWLHVTFRTQSFLAGIRVWNSSIFLRQPRVSASSNNVAWAHEKVNLRVKKRKDKIWNNKFVHRERKESEQHLMCKQERRRRKEENQTGEGGWVENRERKESAKRFGVKNYELGHDRDRVESIKSAIKRVVLINLLLRQLKYLLRHQSQTMMMTMIFARRSELETKFFVYFSLSQRCARQARAIY